MRGSSQLVLNFHGLGTPMRPLDDGEDEYWLTADQFEAILDAVVARGGTDVKITFDDGNQSDADIALPALARRKLRASFFPLAGRMGTPGSLDESAIRMLVDAGMEIGTHGMNHRAWRRLDDAASEEEIVAARRVLEDAAGRKIGAAACPFGVYDRRSLQSLKRAGYRAVFTSDGGRANPGSWLQGRNTITRSQPPGHVTALLEREPSVKETATRSMKSLVKRWR